MAESMFEPTLTDHGSNGQAATKQDDEELSRFLEDTLGSVLRSARESAAGMMERAKRAAADEVARTERLNAAAQAEVDRMTAWRGRVDPLVRDANERAEAIQRAVADVPGRVADALAPVNDALADMDHVMARLTEALRPPTGGDGGGPSGPVGGTRSSVPADDVSTEQPERPLPTVGEHLSDSSVDVPAASAEGSHEPEVDIRSPEASGSSDPDGNDRSDETQTYLGAEVTELSHDADASPDQDTTASSADDHETRGSDPDPDVAASSVSSQTGSTTPVASTSRWVDWSASGNGPTPVARISNGTESSEISDDDEVGLRSATSQLRRAVTDIDWNDLPSTSHG